MVLGVDGNWKVEVRCSESLPRSTNASSHLTQLRLQLGVLLLYLELGPGGFGVGERVDDLAFCPGELGGALKVLEGFGDLALLEKKLGHGGHGDVTFRVD